MESINITGTVMSMSYLKSFFQGSFIAFGICVSWCGATQFFKSLLLHSNNFRAPCFVFIVYTSFLLLATIIIFLLSDIYTRKCCSIVINNEIAISNRDTVTKVNCNPLMIDNTKNSISDNAHSKIIFREHVKGFRTNLKYHIKSLYGLNIHPRTGKAQGKRKAVVRLILFSFLWSSSLYFYLLASNSISPSELTTVFSSNVPFVYAFLWVLLHARFLATKIIAIICFTTTIILITHYRGEFLNYLGQVMIVVLSSILYALFKVNFQNVFGMKFHLEHNHSNRGNASSKSLFNDRVNLHNGGKNFNTSHATMESINDEVLRNSCLRNYYGNIDNRHACNNSALHNLNQTSLFYAVLSFFNLLLFWPLVILFQFTGVEQVPYTHIKWTYLVFAALLHTSYTLFIELAAPFTMPNVINFGVCLSVIINAGTDIYLNRLHFNVMVQVAYSFIILGFLIFMLPDDWYRHSSKILQIKKVNGHIGTSNGNSAYDGANLSSATISHQPPHLKQDLKNINNQYQERNLESRLSIPALRRHTGAFLMMGMKTDSSLIKAQELHTFNHQIDKLSKNATKLIKDSEDTKDQKLITAIK